MVQHENSNLNGETIGADDMGRKDGGDTKQRDEAETNNILDEFQKVRVLQISVIKLSIRQLSYLSQTILLRNLNTG